MKITLEEPTVDHMESREIADLTRQIPSEAVLGAESAGNIVRIIIREQAPVGIVAIMNREDVMVAVHPDHQKCGIATKALGLFAAIVFEEMRLSKVTFTTMPGRPSNILAEKFGVKKTSITEREQAYEFTKGDWENYKSK